MRSATVYQLLLALALGGMGLLAACQQDSIEEFEAAMTPPGDTLVSFAGDLLPLIEAYCSISGCHDGSNGLADALTSYAEVRPVADSIIAQVARREMPIGITLTETEIAMFTRWLAQGALNN